jgi:hypothetical protein
MIWTNSQQKSTIELKDNSLEGRLRSCLTLARSCPKVTFLTGKSSSPSLRYTIAVLESGLPGFAASKHSATLKTAPGSHCPPGKLLSLVSKIQWGCWLKTTPISFKAIEIYFCKEIPLEFISFFCTWYYYYIPTSIIANLCSSPWQPNCVVQNKHTSRYSTEKRWKSEKLCIGSRYFCPRSS